MDTKGNLQVGVEDLEDLESRFLGNQIDLALSGSILIPADGSMVLSSERSVRTGTEVLLTQCAAVSSKESRKLSAVSKFLSFR